MLFAYSCGRVLLQRNKKIMPELGDLVIVIVLWILALAIRNDLSTMIWFLIALMAGIAVSLVLRKISILDSKDQQIVEEKNILKRMWVLWKDFAFRLGNFQARMILGFFYFTILVPFGFISRFFVDPLNMKISNKRTLWFEYDNELEDIQAARRQF